MGYAAAELLMQQRTVDHDAQAGQPDHASLPAGSRPVTTAAPDAPTIGIGQNIMRHDLLGHDPVPRAEPRPVAMGTPPGALVPELAAMQPPSPLAGLDLAALQSSSPALGQAPGPVMGAPGSAPGNTPASASAMAQGTLQPDPLVTLPPGSTPFIASPATSQSGRAASADQAQPAQPPYLASQTAARMGSPQEPWAETIGTLMLVLGIALITCFVLPWRLSPGVAFSWDILLAAPPRQKLEPLLIAGTGVLAVVMSVLALGVLVRGIATAILGFVPLAITSVFLPAFHGTGILHLVAASGLITGLLLRSEYPSALTPRLIATVGVLCALLLLVLPRDGNVPLVALFQTIAGGPIRAKLMAITGLLWAVLTLLALLVWLPQPGALPAKILAWTIIAQPLAISLIALFVQTPLGGLVDVLKQQLHGMLLAPLAAVAWGALMGYGAATVVAKRLEHS